MKKLLTLISLLILCSVGASAAEKQMKTNYRTALVMAYSPANSIYEDENIKLEIFNERLWATNKTPRTIFIDLSQSFLIHNGSSYPMFDKEQNEKAASKSKASTVDEFISIAPATGSKQNETFICKIASGNIYGKYTTTESPTGDFSEYEERLLTVLNEMVNESLMADPKGKEYLGTASRHLTEDESVSNVGATIAYSFIKRSDKAEDWIPVQVSTWVSDMYLTPYYVEMPPEIKKKDKQGFGVKKTDSAKIRLKADSPFEFDSDKSPLIVCDWTGNFKKGTFELNPTWISKKKGGIGTALLASFATVITAGIAAPLLMLVNDESEYYKRSIVFEGQNSDWGNMKYLSSPVLSAFGNERD